MKTPEQGIISAAIFTLAGLANAQPQLTKAIKRYNYRRIPGAVALAAFGLAANVASADTLNAIYNSATDVPVTASSYTATGNTVNFTLNYAPATGTDLMVVKNTGLGLINGTFDNLTNRQPVALSYGGIIYPFVANYYSGSGNDLVLVWGNNRALAWGWNAAGQLGDNTKTNRLVPVAVTATGVLASKTVLAMAAGRQHSLALCGDGTVCSWGYNDYGQLGDNTTTQRLAPVAVNAAAEVSALYGKTVVTIVVGESHNLALCSDGTLVAWGRNDYGQLGDNSTTQRNAPVVVNTNSGVSALYGKTVVAIAAGSSHSLALCSDGTVAAWGYNSNGQLGDNTTTRRNAPVAVNTNSGVSVLYGKTVVAIAAGSSHSLALCSDGTVAAWGYNSNGQLGDNNPGPLQRIAPVAVNTNSGVSALYGKTVAAIAAGGNHSLALCSDGTLTAWGYNSSGQLGDNTTTQRTAPVAVNTNSGVSALYGKAVVAIAAGSGHSLAHCSDSTMAAWGDNLYGELGDNKASGFQSLVPVAVNTTSLAVGERFTRVARGSIANHTLTMVAVASIPEINLTGNGVNISNGDSTPSLADGTDFGSAQVAGGTVVRTFTIQNTGLAPVSLTGMPKVVVSGAHAADFTVTLQPTSPVASLTGATTFQVSFAPSVIGTRVATLSITNDDAGENPYTCAIQGTGSGALGATLDINYDTGREIPLMISGLTATGSRVNFTLNFAPDTGTELMVVQNTGLGFINGTFDNLTNRQPVALSYGGTNYLFLANYYGGSGNDLVLVWANNRALAWGLNASGQLGDNTGNNRLLPVPVTATGVLAGKTLMAIAVGGAHSLALCSDSTVAAWGYNYYGQLGDQSTANRLIPVAVKSASFTPLYRKTVIAVAAGSHHSLALCSDGTVAAWGSNTYGELGTSAPSPGGPYVPVQVSTNSGSALYGKTVVGIAAGGMHNLALCSDGTVAAWGYNSFGQLGDNGASGLQSTLPVVVDTSTNSPLNGKTVVAIAAGYYHSLALCSDGTVAAWGYNYAGQLGDSTTTSRSVPVAVNTTSGSALYGRTIVAIAAGYIYSLALSTDGILAAWGDNFYGQLGDNTTTARHAPVAVNTVSGVSALYGKTPVAIGVGEGHSLALCATGTVAAWGYNNAGQLGDNTTVNRPAPVAVKTTSLAPGERFTRVATGGNAEHTLALAAAPPAPGISVTGNSVTIPNGRSTATQADGTDFGSAGMAGATAMRTFTIQNTGMAPLHLTGSPTVAVSGLHAADFTVTQPPISPVAGLTGTTTFQVTFVPSALGMRMATLTVTNDDANGSPYTFAVQGTGAGTVAANYTTGDEVPLTTSGFTAIGSTVNFTLNFTPEPGTELMVLKNTVLGFISGTFDNLTNGQPVGLSYSGTDYNFVANYYGGNGNDLVLVWANQRPFAWGGNDYGQLGGNTTNAGRLIPVPVTTTGPLAGKTVVALAGGAWHSLALCSDGMLATWGRNSYGQLGDNTTTNRVVPVAVNTSTNSALYGKAVVALAGGVYHSLAICSDGTVAAWGADYAGQLGDNQSPGLPRTVPVAVNTASGLSALYGKAVVAIAAGEQHSLGLCSDGTVAAWGNGSLGQIGDNTRQSTRVPVAVNTASGLSALYGKTAVTIAAGIWHSLALCSDGTVAAWGDNSSGQLGDNTTTQRNAPVAVNMSTNSALYGKAVVAIAAGLHHSLALCSDGSVAAWGDNSQGQLGNNITNISYVPLEVNITPGVSALYGRTVVAIAAGQYHSLALCSDGTVAAWGYNNIGQLGDNTTTNRSVPVAVNPTSPAPSQRFTRVASSPSANHTLALVAAPPGCETALTAAQTLTSGAFQFGFTNTPGAFFSVFAATNPALPLSNWTSLGDPTEVSAGQFQFTDPQATNSPRCFYRVRSP
jgi:alpha-tubulin suppressor-like RCC1 family protein